MAAEVRTLSCPFCLEAVGVMEAFESDPMESVWHEECYELDQAQREGPTS